MVVEGMISMNTLIREALACVCECAFLDFDQ